MPAAWCGPPPALPPAYAPGDAAWAERVAAESLAELAAPVSREPNARAALGREARGRKRAARPTPAPLPHRPAARDPRPARGRHRVPPRRHRAPVRAAPLPAAPTYLRSRLAAARGGNFHSPVPGGADFALRVAAADGGGLALLPGVGGAERSGVTRANRPGLPFPGREGRLWRHDRRQPGGWGGREGRGLRGPACCVIACSRGTPPSWRASGASARVACARSGNRALSLVLLARPPAGAQLLALSVLAALRSMTLTSTAPYAARLRNVGKLLFDFFFQSSG